MEEREYERVITHLDIDIKKLLSTNSSISKDIHDTRVILVAMERELEKLKEDFYQK